jgi:transposase InsO family protein
MAVCREVRRQTLTAGERAIAAAVKEYGVTRYEVRRELRRVKQLARLHLARRRAADRRSVQPLAKDALWAEDATKVGDAAAPAVEAPAVPAPAVEVPAVAAPAEDERAAAAVPTVALLAEVVRDVATTRTVGLSIGPAADAEDVVSLLDRIIAERGVAPLVWSTDNGSPYVSQRLIDYLRARQIVHLRNLPRTPQHNAAAERGEGELKAGARFLPADDPETRARKLLRTADRLNRYRRRATRKGLTAHEADLILPPATSIVSREEFYEACRIAVEEAMKAKTSRRAQRLAERGAIYAVMERYGLVKITGGRRRAAPPASLSN